MNLSGLSLGSEKSLSSLQESVDGALKNAAGAQHADLIREAVRLFEWAPSEKEFAAHPASNKIAIQSAAFTDSPAGYLATAGSALFSFSEVVPMGDVLHALLNSEFRPQQGVRAFLQSGVQEALASMKLTPVSGEASPAPLDELLRPEKLKSADPAVLQASLRAMKRMFSSLSKVQNENMELKANLAQFLRC